MATPPKVSDAEWQVMDVLWDAAPAAMTAAEVVDALAGTTWNPRTIKTMLNRLVKKRALKFQAERNRYLYRPAVSRQACVRTESRSFLRRVFGGDVAPMLAHFVEESKLSRREIGELRKLLDRRGKGR
jgi:BlaI family penicillinase repressor